MFYCSLCLENGHCLELNDIFFVQITNFKQFSYLVLKNFVIVLLMNRVLTYVSLTPFFLSIRGGHIFRHGYLEYDSPRAKLEKIEHIHVTRTLISNTCTRVQVT